MNGETTIRYWPRAISCLDAGWKQLEGYIHSFIQRIRGGRAGLHLAARTYLGGYSSPNPLGHPDTERYFPSFSHGYLELRRRQGTLVFSLELERGSSNDFQLLVGFLN